jgi:hypothetical protein
MEITMNKELYNQIKEEWQGKPIKYKEWDCLLNVQSYAIDGSVCITLDDAEDGCPVADATVYVENANLGELEICVPEYKYAGMVSALVNAGVAKDNPSRQLVEQEYVKFPVLELIIPL